MHQVFKVISGEGDVSLFASDTSFKPLNFGKYSHSGGDPRVADVRQDWHVRTPGNRARKGQNGGCLFNSAEPVKLCGSCHLLTFFT